MSSSIPPPLPSGVGSPNAGLSAARAVVASVGERLRAVIKGRDDVIELLLIALLADGHVLLEDYPGSGKTTLARALGDSLLLDGPQGGIAAFRRIQFTPDLLPTDITGTNVFDVETSTFSFRRGPIFAHIVLADEINRTSPKVQAAMLEAMAEKQVTVDNQTYPLDDLFFVVATQNPVDVAGTYPLPTPQLDRFLFKIAMTHIDRESELQVLEQYPVPSLDFAEQHPVVRRSDVLIARRHTRESVHVAPEIRMALVDLARALRNDERVLQGASTRALVLMMPALQARALLHERDYVAPADVEALAPHIFRHRLDCAPGESAPEAIIAQHVQAQVEKLARASLRRL